MRRDPTIADGARGFIVVAVLWILAALSALVLIYLTYVTNTAVVVAGSTDRVQTEALVTAGVELAAYQLTAVNEAARPTSGTFNARVGAGRVSVTFRSEAARIDLNAAPKGLLAGLMVGLGAGASDAAGYADRILAWRAPTEVGDDDPENSFYRTSGVAYVPRHAPFPAAEELWLVRGIPPAVVERMLPFVTVFSNLRFDQHSRRRAAGGGGAAGHDAGEPAGGAGAARRSRARSAMPCSGWSGGEGATLAGSKAYRMTVGVDFDGRTAQRGGGRDPASRQRRRALSCIVVAQRLRRQHGDRKRLPRDEAVSAAIGAILSAWTDSVAAAIIAGFDRVVSPRVVRLIEDDDGGFAVEAPAASPDNVPARIALRRRQRCPRPISRRCSGAAGSRSCCSRSASCSVRSNCRRGRRISSTASCARRSTA